MKSTISLLLTLFVCSYSFAQFPKLWKTGKTKEINGYSILREEGSGRTTPYIYFTDSQQLVNDILNDSKNEMWQPEKTEQALAASALVSGYLYIHISTQSVEESNTEHYSVIIHNLNNEEIYRKRLDPSVPNYEIVEHMTIWNNYAVLSIPADVIPPFRVFTINHFTSNDKHKKKVYLVQKADDTNKYDTQKSSQDTEQQNGVQFEINEIVWLVLEGEKVEAKVIAISGSRCRVEYLNNKGKTKSATVSVSDLTKMD